MHRVLLVYITMTIAGLGEGPSPPRQPTEGPGGAKYPHATMRESVHGAGGKEYWIFEPQAPAVEKAPLIIFLHGFSVMDPHGYRGWIEHLVRRGNVVVYPRYQESLLTRPADFHPNMVEAVRDAVAVLKKPSRTQIDFDRVATVGHSAGAVLALRYTAAAAEEELPVPRAAVILQPGQGPKNGVNVLPLPAREKLPRDLRLIVAVGDKDTIVGEESARRVWRETSGLPERAYVKVQTDLHGEPRLRAGHLSPMAADLELADALDWFGWWRLFDVACDSAFKRLPLRVEPGMGNWSDGQPVKPLVVQMDSVDR